MLSTNLFGGNGDIEEEMGKEELMLEPSEQAGLDQLVQKLNDLQSVFNRQLPASTPVDWSAWNNFLAEIKQVTGNLHNEASFIGVMLAKDYLRKHYPDIQDYDAAAKKQGAAGLDIDLKTQSGTRIIAELKTTEPSQEKDFGARQQENILNDLMRLATTQADFKYFFVTSRRTFNLITQKPKYKQYLKNVEVVLL